MQELVVGHEIPRITELLVATAPLSTQVEPSKPMANGLPVPETIFQPAAMHQVDDRHETELNSDIVAPAGTPVAYAVQVEPLLDCAIEPGDPELPRDPTVMQKVEVDGHDDPLRTLTGHPPKFRATPV
jgi:hypothetical protein